MGIPNHGDMGLSLCEDFSPGYLEGRAQSRLPADPLVEGGSCHVAHPALATMGHGLGGWRAVGIFRKAQPRGTGTFYLSIQPIPCSCWYLGVHPR